MKYFFDIGAHNGQTLEEVVHPRWNFDRILAFEPMPREYDLLDERFGHRDKVRLYNFGLSDKTGWQPVYGGNDRCEASVYPSKVDLDPNIVSQCRFVDAAEPFSALADDATVIVKMNCEGSEIPILNRLIDTGDLWRITAMTFDLDIRRVRGHEQEADELLARLERIGFDRFQVSSDAFIEGTHAEKIAYWLTSLA